MTEAIVDEGQQKDGEGQPPVMSVEDLQEQMKKMQESMDKLAMSKERILEESQTYKKKYQDIKSAKDEEEKARMIAEGKTEELAERYQNEAHSWQKRYGELKANVLESRVETEILKIAPDVIRVKDLKDNFSIEAIKIGEDLSVAGIKEEVDRVRKEFPHYFKPKDKASQFTRKAPGVGEQANYDDKEAYHAELSRCMDQKSMDACKRKWGRLT